MYNQKVMISDLDLKRQQKIGEKLKASREETKLTQAQVAKAAKITTNYYAMIERGEANLSASKLLRLVMALKIKSFDLIDFL